MRDHTPKRVAILGSTGSVGCQALQLIADRPERFSVVALTAHRSAQALQQQVERFEPVAVCLVAGEGDESADSAWLRGADGVLEALEAGQPDIVLNAITGAAGLPASEWALRRGIPLALANKESLVVAGDYLMQLAADSGAPILPVDSEHCAVFQCLQGEDRGKVRRIYLTGSGGPFRERALDTFADITPAEALRHPTWEMGPRITIGSATMMNKAFEILEARWLFGLEPDQIRVLIHPQSIVHSIVEFVDGSMLAQLGRPDMRVPILYCLAYPERVPFEFEPFDPVAFSQLTFAAVDEARYPAIPLAYDTLRAGGDSGAVLNAADEVLTGMFLDGKARFTAITDTVTAVVRDHSPKPVATLADVHAADQAARRAAMRMLH